MTLCVCRRYSSVGLQYSYQEIPTAEALAAMLEKSPITHAAQVRVRYHLLIWGHLPLMSCWSLSEHQQQQGYTLQDTHLHSPVTLMCWVVDRKLESGFSHRCVFLYFLNFVEKCEGHWRFLLKILTGECLPFASFICE